MLKMRYENKQLIFIKNDKEFAMDTNQWAVKKDNEVYPFNDAKKITCIENNGMEILFEGIVEGCSVKAGFHEENDAICVTMEPIEDTFVFDEMVFPGTIQTKDGFLVLPLQQGTLLDTKENISFVPSFGGCFGCADAYVNALGFYSDACSYLWFVDDYEDSGYQIDADQYSMICMRTFSSLAHLSYTRKMHLYVFDHLFDYNDMAHLIRKRYDENGLLTLKEKIERKPVLKKLVGSCVYHTGIHSKISKDSRYYHAEGENEAIVPIADVQKKVEHFHEQGIDHIHLHLDGCGIAYDNQHPRFYPIDERTGGYPALKKLIETLHAYNDVVSFHDNYHDLYLDSPDFKEEYQIYDRDQKPYFMSVWAGGKQSYMTGQMAPVFFKRNLAYLKEQGVESDGVYCDVFTCNPFDENFNDAYRMNRKQCREYRNDTFDVCNERGMIVSSEEINVFALNHIDTCHYAPYPFMMKQDGKQIGLPIPFFNLCFHDCVVIPWMSDRNYGLYALLNGGIPYLERDGAYVNTDGSFSEDVVDEKRIAMVKEIASFEEKVAYAKMVRHTFVNGDENIQETVFNNGITVTIDLRNDSYQIVERNARK